MTEFFVKLLLGSYISNGLGALSRVTYAIFDTGNWNMVLGSFSTFDLPQYELIFR